MTDPSGYEKCSQCRRLRRAPPRRYDDVTAHAITRDDSRADVRGIDATLDLIREPRGGA